MSHNKPVRDVIVPLKTDSWDNGGKAGCDANGYPQGFPQVESTPTTTKTFNHLTQQTIPRGKNVSKSGNPG